MATELPVPVVLSPVTHNRHFATDYRYILCRRVKLVDTVPSNSIPLGAYDAWTPRQFLSPSPIALRGYFQYLPAVQQVLPRILDDIVETLSVQRDMLRTKYSLTNLHTVGFIHVRRGDYLNTSPDLHWVQGKDYYIRALASQPSVSRWLVLSDDINWCKKQSFLSSYEIVDEPNELAGLSLMSLCRGGAIIANSTYSWWGAMLGAEDARAPVVYPSKWYGYEKPDLFPNSWTCI
jgi:hypothetical protein